MSCPTAALAHGSTDTTRHRATTGAVSAPTSPTNLVEKISSSTVSTARATRCSATLEDPRSPEGFAIRGLVIGHVQSGKTQNFSALIAKAADAGYKIVIVLSGLHNTLRQQTQRRLERDLGRENVVGVGEPEAGRRWQWMTGAESWGDFDPRGVSAAVVQGNEQVIFVVKKNKTRLERLITGCRDGCRRTCPYSSSTTRPTKPP